MSDESRAPELPGSASRVCVIGGGVAGLAAALSARRAGAEVALVSGPFGASAMSSGAWDVAPLEGLDGPWRPGRRIGEAIEAVVRERPLHPYARLAGSTAAGRRALLELAAEAHRELFAALEIYAPLELDGRGVLVATEAGVVRRAASAQRQVLDLDRAASAGDPAVIAVADLRGYRAFDARSIAAALSGDAARHDDRRRFVATVLEFFRRRSDATLGAAETAALLDQADARDRFAAILERDVTVQGLAALLVPPVLGHDDDTVVTKVGAQLPVPLGEALGGPGGPQGLRLHRHVESALARAGVERIDGPATRVVPEHDHVRVELEDGSLSAARVVLATGSLLGGGLVLAQGRLREPLLDLPIGYQGRPLPIRSSASGRDPSLLFGAELAPGGPGSSAGLLFDASMHVIDSDGEPIPRVLACGALLADHDPACDGTGLGVAAITGWVAGRSAARTD